MDARKLVGMTEGAKKRAAIYNCVGRCIRKAVKLTWFKCWNRDFHARVPTIDDDMTNRKYQTLRRLFYVGYKLRPCPGNGCRRGQSWCLRCDGTGVVSAKPKNVRR